MAHQLVHRDAEHFDDPESFVPERWLRGNQPQTVRTNRHPFAYLPFGFGKRMCVGKRFVEMQIQLLTARYDLN